MAKFSEVITEQSRRLGMWMDWDADYYTFTDTNIEYIWRFLKAVHEREWLYQGHRSTVWCPRCGTSISQHELFAGEYRELEHPSLFVRFPLEGREGESLAVWTTTPWTLPANVAAAVNPVADYGLRESGEWVATALHPDETFVRSALGAELVGLSTRGRSTTCPLSRVSSIGSSLGTTSLSTRGPGSSISLLAREPRTSSSRVSTTCLCSRRSTKPGECFPDTGSTGFRPTRSPSR